MDDRKTATEVAREHDGCNAMIQSAWNRGMGWGIVIGITGFCAGVMLTTVITIVVKSIMR